MILRLASVSIFVAIVFGYAALGVEFEDGKMSREFNKLEDAALKREATGKWKAKVDWKESAEVALTQARAENKPVLVLLVVGEWGQKNAPHC